MKIKYEALKLLGILTILGILLSADKAVDPNCKVINFEGLTKITTNKGGLVIEVMSDEKKDVVTISKDLKPLLHLECELDQASVDLTRFIDDDKGNQKTYLDQNRDGLPEGVVTRTNDGITKEKLEFRVVR